MAGRILWLMTNDVEFAAGWGKNPEDKCKDKVWSDSVYIQIVTRNRGLADLLERYNLYESIMLCWGCFRSLEIAAGQARADRGSRWRRIHDEGMALFSTLLRSGHSIHPHPHYEKDLKCLNPDFFYNPENDALEYRPAMGSVEGVHMCFAHAAALQNLGTHEEPESRMGYLHAGCQWLADHLQTAGIAVRSGAWDFGCTPPQQSISEEALRQNGLFVNLDADMNLTMWGAREPSSRPWTESAYLARRGDINQASSCSYDWGLLELPHCSGLGSFAYDLNNLDTETLNRELDIAFGAFVEGDEIRPGVHIISAMSHGAGFVGDPWDWTAGNEFAKVEKHFRYLCDRYVSRGLIKPVTIEEAAAQFLDCYSSRLVAWPAPATWDRDKWSMGIILAGGLTSRLTQTVEVYLPLYTCPGNDAFEAFVCAERGPIHSRLITGPAPRVVFDVEPERRDESYSISVRKADHPD